MMRDGKRFRKANIHKYACITMLATLLLCAIVYIVASVLLLPSLNVSSKGVSSVTPFSQRITPLDTFQLPTVTLTPTVGSSTPSQDQQPNENVIANNTITVANTLITFGGIIVGALTLIVGVATGYSLFQVSKFDGRIKAIDEKLATIDTEVKDILTNKLSYFDNEFETKSKEHFEANYYFNEGTKAYIAGDNASAIENFLRASKKLPNSPFILERLGRAYTNQGMRKEAFECLNKAKELASTNERILRSLALYYRSINNEKEAIIILEQIVNDKPLAFESWDILGLCYRDQLQQGQQLLKDQVIINKAISAHEEALKIKKRPETEFYLGILLYFSPRSDLDDKKRAKELIISASKRVEESEHDLRIRRAWKELIKASALIVEGKRKDALQQVKNMIQYKPIQRINLGVEFHLRFLLEGTGNSKWIPEFMTILNARKGF